jgi:MFS family permease
LRWRLSLLMYIQYAPAGAVIPFLSLHAKELHFTPLELAYATGTQALAAVAGPLVGQIADRWVAAERCLAIMAFMAGAALWLLADIADPTAFILVYLLFWLMMQPAITLGTSVCFSHLSAPERDFGPVRLWGTVGWVTSGLLLGLWFGLAQFLNIGGQPRSYGDALRLGSLLSFVMGAYALTVPHTPPMRQAAARLAPLAALHLLRERSFAVYFACTLGMAVTLPFSSQVTPLLLQSLGIPQPWMGPTLTLSQSMEIVSLALLPVILGRLEVRGTMLLGMIAWVGVLTLLAIGQPLWLVIGALPLNGLCVCGYFVAGQVFVNGRARGDIRASVQTLLACCTGLGMLIGNVLVGEVRRAADEAFPPTFGVGAGIAALFLVIFAVGFKNGSPEARRQPADSQGTVTPDTAAAVSPLRRI